MQVQVNTDNHVNGSAGLTRRIEAVVEGSLERFSRRVTRIEVQLSDENGSASQAETITGALSKPGSPACSPLRSVSTELPWSKR